MKHLRLSQLAILVAALGVAAAPELTGVAANTAFAQEAMRAEVGKPVQQAAELFKAKKYRDALAKLQETDRIGNKSVNETFTIERMRLSIAAALGDNDALIRSAEVIVAANKLSSKEQLSMILVLANSYSKANSYAKAAKMYERYINEGGTDPSARQFMIQSKMMSGDNAGAMKETKAEIAAAEKAGRIPSQTALETYAYGVQKTDKAAYLATLEKLVMYHGKKEYWVNLLNTIERKPEMSSRLTMDLYRLKFAVGQITKTSEYMEMAQIAIQDGYPAEALKIIEQGYKTGVMGTGNEAARHTRLKDMATKKLAEHKAARATLEKDANNAADGALLLSLGYAYVTTGEFDKGLELMEEGIRKDNLKYPEEGTLRLGVAYLMAGKKAAGIKALKSIQTKEGPGDLARYWVIQANQRN